MNWYLDVEAQQIQAYIARSPSLQGLRAGSAMLAESTRLDASTVARWPGSPELNSETPLIDGKLSLILDADTRIGELIDAIAEHLAVTVPAARFRVAWAEGATYQDVHPSMAAGLPGHVRWLGSAQPDFPLTRLCGDCASSTVVIGSESWCHDCGLRKASKRQAPAQQTLLDALDREPAGDFRSLAGLLEGRRTGTQGNHLATVYIDGNSMGKLFSDALHHDAGAVARLSKAVTDATVTALTRATEAVCELVSEKVLPVQAHIVGGDDVLVTVPARAGWTFTLHYLEAFTTELSHASDPAPCASAGLVFHHMKDPIGVAITQAGAVLERAKRQVRGGQASILWLDVTDDGPSAPPWRRALLSRDIDTGPGSQHARLDCVSEMDKSSLGTFRRMALRVDRDGTAASLPSPDHVDHAIRRQADRMGHSDLIEAATALKSADGSDRPLCDQVADVVSLCRWWSPTAPSS